jgi:hypothetical protein
MPEMLDIKEMVSGDHFGFMGYQCWWTGWKQDASRIFPSGQWMAIDPKTNKGYYLSLPGNIFSECTLGRQINTSCELRYDALEIIMSRSYRKKMVKEGREKFKEMVDKAERIKVMKALDTEVKAKEHELPKNKFKQMLEEIERVAREIEAKMGKDSWLVKKREIERTKSMEKIHSSKQINEIKRMYEQWKSYRLEQENMRSKDDL